MCKTIFNLKNEQWRVLLCKFRHPCENWESTPGLKLIVWESHDRMKLPNCYAYCLKVYLPNQNRLFQMCVIVSESATIFNVLECPREREDYLEGTVH